MKKRTDKVGPMVMLFETIFNLFAIKMESLNFVL